MWHDFNRSQLAPTTNPLETYFVTFDYVNIIMINNQATPWNTLFYSCTFSYSIVGFFYRKEAKIPPVPSTLGVSIMAACIHGLSYFQCAEFMLPTTEHLLLLVVPIQLLSPQSLTASKGQGDQTRHHGLIGIADDISLSLANSNTTNVTVDMAPLNDGLHCGQFS